MMHRTVIVFFFFNQRCFITLHGLTWPWKRRVFRIKDPKNTSECCQSGLSEGYTHSAVFTGRAFDQGMSAESFLHIKPLFHEHVLTILWNLRLIMIQGDLNSWLEIRMSICLILEMYRVLEVKGKFGCNALDFNPSICHSDVVSEVRTKHCHDLLLFLCWSLLLLSCKVELFKISSHLEMSSVSCRMKLFPYTWEEMPSEGVRETGTFSVMVSSNQALSRTSPFEFFFFLVIPT